LFLARLHFEEQLDTSFLRADVNVLAEQAKNSGKELHAKTKHSKATARWIAPPTMQIECDAPAQFESVQTKHLAASTSCHFGHPAKVRMYKQDLVPAWRGAPHGAILCYKCRRRLNFEINTSDHPLVTTATTPPSKVRLNGPCFFGHQSTSAQDSRGKPRWQQIPAGKTWRGANSLEVICQACFQRMVTSDESKMCRASTRKEITNVDDYFDMIRSKRANLALDDAHIDIIARHYLTTLPQAEQL